MTQIENQDIFTASSGGTTRFTIANNGDLTTVGDFAVNGGDITTNSTTASLFNTTATTINFGGGATTALNLGSSTANTVNVPSLSASSAVYTDGSKNLTSTAPTSGTIGYWQRSSTTISPATSGDSITTSGNIYTTGAGEITSAGLLTASGGVTSSGTVAVNAAGGITTNQTTFPLLNTTATTINFGGGATTSLNIGSGVASTVNVPSLTASRFVLTDGSKNIISSGLSSVLSNTLTDETGSGGVAVFNSSPVITTALNTSSSTFSLLNTTATTINFGGAVNAGGINFAGGSGSTGCTIDGTNGNLTCSGQISGATIDTAFTAGSVVFAGASGVLTEDNSGLFYNDTNNLLGVGTASPISELHVTRPLSSGATGKALAIFNQIENQDILTASAGGTTRFSVTNAGGIELSGGYGTLGQCLMSGGITGATATWGDCSSGGGAGTWVINDTDGTISPINDTLDLVIGGTATASAKFLFTNLNTGNPTLKIYDSSSSNFLSLYNDGTDSYVQSNIGDVVIGTGTGDVNIEDAILNRSTNNDGSLTVGDKLLVQYAENNLALAVFDNTGTGDILTASSGGTTRFTIANNGDLTTVGDFAVNGGDITTNSTTASLFNTTATTINFGGGATTALNLGSSTANTVNVPSLSASSAVYTDGSKNLTSTAPTSGTIGYWQRSSTTISPATSGDSITTSGNIYTTGAGEITSAGLLTASGGVTSSGTVAVNAAGGITTNQTTFPLLNTTATTINFGGGATTSLNIGSGVASTVNVPSLTASRFVLTDGSKNIISSGLSSVLSNTLTDETGSGGVAVFNSSPVITTALNTSSSTFSLLNTTATTINFGGGATTALNLGSSTANTVNVPSLSASSAVYTDGSKNLTSTAPTSGTIGYWQRSSTTISPATSGDSITTSGNIYTTGAGEITSAGLLTASGGVTSSGTVAVNAAGGITTNQTTFPLLNTTATTINFGGGATTSLNIGSGVASTVNVPSLTASRFVLTDGSKNIISSGLSSVLSNTLTDETGSGGVAVFNSSPVITTALNTSSSTFSLLNTTATTINFGGAVNAGGINFAGGSGSTGCTIDGTNGNLTCSGQISGATIDTAFTAGSVVFAGASGVLTEDNSGLFYNDTNNLLGVGTASPISELHVTRPLSSGATGKALAIFNQIENQDILTASAGGTTRFTVSSAGAIGITSGYGGVGDCLKSGGSSTAAVTWGACGTGGGGAGTWVINDTDGTISPINDTLDLVIGGTATASAKFLFTNLNTGNPTLKIYDSSSSNFLSLYNDGTDSYVQSNIGDVVIGTGTGDVNIEDAILNRSTNNDGSLTVGDKLLVQYAENNLALAVFDNTGTGDILTASASGATLLTLNNSGNLLPGTDDAQDLGSTSLRWQNLYLGPASIHIGSGASDESILSYNTISNQFELDYNGDTTADYIFGSGGLDANSNLITNIGNTSTDFTSGGGLNIAGTLNANGTVALGNGNDVSINSNDWDIDSAGVASGFTGLTSSGTITFGGLSGSGTRVVYAGATGALTTTAPTSGTIGYWQRSSTTISPATSGDSITTSGNIYTTGAGTITSAGLLTGSAGLTVSGGSVSLNNSAGTNTTNIGTGTTTGAVTIGGNSNTLYINTSDWDISTTGVMTGISGITTDGGYTQSGATGNTFSGAVTMTSGFDSNSASTVTGLTIDGNSGTALNISGTSFTTDLNLQNGETIDNDTNGSITFANNASANYDTIALNPGANAGSSRFAGAITTADLSAARTWTFPNASGTVAVSASSPLSISATGDVSCSTCLVTGDAVTSVSGTANQITATGTTAVTLSIPSTFIAPGTIEAQGTGTALTLSGAATTAINISNTGVTTDIKSSKWRDYR